MKKEGLCVQSLQLNFTSQQLQQLNVYFSNMETCEADLKHNQMTNWIEGEIDKLIQYLCAVVGCLDSRFRSEFLIRLEPSKIFNKNNYYSYVIRLDSFSTVETTDVTDFNLEFGNKIPCGFGKIKLENETSYKRWGDCATNGGYLQRDKIQKKYVELLKEASSAKPNSIQNIENLQSNIPGKIIDAETLYYILNIPRSERIFYGSSENSKQFNSEDMRKFRIEVIESDHLIKLRIGFLSSNIILDEDVDVVLILGIGLQGWPTTSDYPDRVLFTNFDILLHHQIATTGFFMITASPRTMENNENQTVLWQFFFPAADCILLNHFSELSCVIRTISIVYSVMVNLRRTTSGGHTVGKYIIKTLIWFQLEKLNDLKYWTTDYLSYHVISLLDEIVQSLRKQECRSYFFEHYNALTNSFCNSGSAQLADDFKEDADIMETFIHRIYKLSSSELIGHQTISSERRRNTMSVYESTLINKWNNLLMSMNENRKQVDDQIMGYIFKQIEYITFLFRAILITKSVIIPVKNHKINTSHSPINYSNRILRKRVDHDCTISSEDFSFVMSAIFNQAKGYFTSMRRAKKTYNLRTLMNTSKSDSKIETQYDETVHSIINRINENSPVIFRNDIQAVKFLLRTLYENIASSKILREVLKPYLKSFSISTHKSCWYLEEWKNRIENDELVALKIFSRLVSDRKMEFKTSLLDALQKGWDWADEIIKLCLKLKNNMEVLFDLPNGQIIRYSYLNFSDKEIERLTKYKLNFKKYGYTNAINELCGTLKFDEKSELYCEEDIPVHFTLRDGSPLTQVINCNRRYGMHPGLGNIIFSLVILGKFTALQEITEILPEEKRHQALENIQRAIKIKQRADREKGKSKDREEIYRSLPYRHHEPLTRMSNGKIPNNVVYARNENIKSSFDDDQSPRFTFSQMSASASSVRVRNKDTVRFNSIAYYDAPVTYFQEDVSSTSFSSTSWRNPTAQPYLHLTQDKNLSFFTNGDESCSRKL